MIRYKFEEELEYLLYYANKSKNKEILKILTCGEVKSSGEAISLSEFFWNMVDLSIEDEKSGIELPWEEGAEFWNEKIMNSISGYLERAGYEKEWDEVSDR